MLAKVISGAIVGLDGAIVEVEVDILSGLPKVIIVGLPDTAVEESSERVRSAINNSGGNFPMRRIVVNLALTIADLESCDIIKANHIAEAVQYRPRRTE
jgi:magnesium chelatase family protein